ncbi:M56 family metallopeptidase [Pedobacter sp. Leaf250]|uniref:M56 family metallopeptidase n=1 Tax=Pedobacter sp. Leaf250 TaxID=2876559 RepID=UPI001E3D1155|nr:M56 family metallopeptidase [Pedobacter sp. Leaf250]
MSFAHYLLQVNLYLIVFYGFYKLLLDKETYFLLNRIYLVSAGVLSLSIPFIRLEWLTEQKAAQQVYTSVNWEAVLEKATIVTDSNTNFSWGNFLVYIYCTGIIFCLCRLAYNLLSVKKLIKNAKAGSAFSFFSKKVVDKNLPSIDVIDIHEEAHIKQWHTADVLFFEIIGVLTWVNPIIYFYKKSIKNIHEFLADEHAAEFQGDKAEYAMLILSQSFGISPNRLTNGFFDKSLIKKRIFMLQKERSKKIAVMKYGFFIPLFAILIIFSSATVRKNEELISITNQIPLDKPIEMVREIIIPEPKFNPEKISTTEIIPTTEKVDGNWNGFYNFMAKSIKYPSAAQKNNLQGNTQIKFTLQNNKVTYVSSILDLGDGCDEEVMKALLSYRKFENLPNGKYTLKVGFTLAGNKAAIKNKKAIIVPSYQKLSDINVVGYSLPAETEGGIDDKPEKVFDFVSIEKQPEFPGGISKFYEYLSKSIKYPKLAQENNVQGKVFLSFIVEKDGSLSDVAITRGLGSGLDEEAIRVLNGSPRWNPGVTGGKPVRVKYNINVNFSMSNEAEAKKAVQIKGLSTSNVFRNAKFEGVVVLNGKESHNGFDFTKIDNREIQSVTVLKDAAATSLYGEKGKNGVLIITTKNYDFRRDGDTELKINTNTPTLRIR